MIHDCIVVGAGPAGVTAAIQLKRSGCSVLLLEKNEVGGLLRNARRIENFPGFPGGISGMALVERLKEQLHGFGIEVKKTVVREILRGGHHFLIRTNERTLRARNVIIATGTKPKRAGIPGEEELAGERVFYDIADFLLSEPEGQSGFRRPDCQYVNILTTGRRAKTVLIIGGGDSGFDYALNLHDRGCCPVIVTRGEAQCLPMLRAEVEARGIPCREHVVPREIRREGKGVRLLAVCRGATVWRPMETLEGKMFVEVIPPTGRHTVAPLQPDNGNPRGTPLRAMTSFAADLILIAVGREPQLPTMPSEIAGLYVVGDARGGPHRQVCIAAGDALCAAMNVAESLRNC